MLDNNPDQVEFMRRFGMKSFYGDPSRVDLLNSAGAGAARLLIVAVDDPGEAVKIVETARKNFPHLKIVARAKGRTDALSLTRAGAEGVGRATTAAVVSGAIAILASNFLLTALLFGVV